MTKPQKLMVVGLPKTGTSTIHKALVEAGRSSVHWQLPQPDRRFVGALIYESYFKSGDPWPKELAATDCIAQADVCWPDAGLNLWPNLDFALLGAMRRLHPECFFLLNTRQPQATVSSMSQWLDMRARLVSSDIPGLPKNYGATDAELTSWIEGHYAACRAFFAGDDRFLEVAIEDPETPRRIERLLGIDLPWWGVANANPAMPQKQPARRPSPASGTLSGAFSEDYYLASNPDVAAAVAAGSLRSGAQHYEVFGRNEGRAPNVSGVCLMMQRNERDLLGPWIAYHADLFGIQNLRVFDNGSDDPETLAQLERWRQQGLAVDFTHDQVGDFERKGRIIADTIKYLDRTSPADFYFPLDCDEFVAVSTENGPSIDPTDIATALMPLLRDPRVLAIDGAFDNSAVRHDAYRRSPTQRKRFFAQGTCLTLDRGFHEARTVSGEEILRTSIAYFHFHYRPYALMQQFSKAKLRGRVKGFDPATLRAYREANGAGSHLVPALIQSQEDYERGQAAGLGIVYPRFQQHLTRLGYPIAWSCN